MVVGFVEDKDLSRVLPAASPAGALRVHEGRDPPRARRARARAPGRRLRIAGRVRPDRERGARAARELAGPEDMIFIGGSTYVVAEVL